MSCPKCFAGHVHPGQPKGQFETVYGRKTYVALPPDDKAAKGIVVVIPDAFGVGFVNNQILADHYAAAGQFKVYLPDFMDGKEAPVSCMMNMAHVFDEKTSWPNFVYYIAAAAASFIPFMITNRFGVAWPRITSWFTALREDQNSLPIGVAGFCWGGLFSIYLTHNRPDTVTKAGRPLADAFFGAHVSNISMPADAQAITRPFSLAMGDKDAVLAFDKVKEFEKVLEAKKDVETEVVVYPGAKHGFAVRASKTEPDSTETRQAEEAEQQAISWFQKQFAKVK